MILLSLTNFESSLSKMNPVWKIYILIIITFLTTFDFMPFLSISLIIISLTIVKFFSDIKIRTVVRSISPLILVSIGYILVITITRYFTQENINLINTSAIGIRIILIGIYSNIFVNTTNPTEFVMSLSKYFGMPIKWSYSFLSAYRFLPSFKSEFEIIKFAHQVRGLDSGKNFIERIFNSRRYIIPMMATAIRKGIRVSMAMETKGFGKYSERTSYRELKICKKDVLSFSVFILIVVIITATLIKYNLTDFSIVYKDS